MIIDLTYTGFTLVNPMEIQIGSEIGMNLEALKLRVGCLESALSQCSDGLRDRPDTAARGPRSEKTVFGHAMRRQTGDVGGLDHSHL